MEIKHELKLTLQHDEKICHNNRAYQHMAAETPQ